MTIKAMASALSVGLRAGSRDVTCDGSYLVYTRLMMTSSMTLGVIATERSRRHGALSSHDECLRNVTNGAQNADKGCTERVSRS